ncbi:MAG: alginate export family protein, partial [Bacteroidales bacterium]|nr:alginate export family protein [Bacteroidales bacterium]
MRKVNFYYLVGLVFLLLSGDIFAQDVAIYGVFRPRFENRHGYNTIFPEHAQAANFISQRSRLGLKFANDNLKVGFSIQNVGVWGETGTLSVRDMNGTAVHEAWGEILFSDKFSIKAGRQEIIYDDHRIFGSVDWAQQGRSHDAAILKLKPKEGCAIDIGFAYNALGESLMKNPYMQNNYKALQYIHWQRKFGNFGASFLLLNNGMPYINPHDTTGAGVAKENIAYSQTIGPRFTYKKDKISANAAFYYQMGKRTILDPNGVNPDTTMKIGAMYFAFDIAAQVTENISIGAGVEYLSGNDEKKIADNDKGQEKEKAFAPLYGTNHKFNGWMDYFYVGNHFGSVGLMDIFIPVKYKNGKFSAMLIPHIFSSAGTLYRQERDDDWNLIVDATGNPVMKELKKGL